MELIGGVLGTTWELLKSNYLPIINLSIADFLLGVLVLTVVVDIINFFLGKSLTSRPDSGGESGKYMASRGNFVIGKYKRR